MTITFSEKFPKQTPGIGGELTGFVPKLHASLEKFIDWTDLLPYLSDYAEKRKNFVPAQEVIPKKHTIRNKSSRDWKPGRMIDFKIWTDKPYKSKTMEVAPRIPCKSVQSIEITYWNDNFNPRIEVDGRVLNEQEKFALALNDGFKNLQEFFNWFRSDFKGIIIHWTDLKY